MLYKSILNAVAVAVAVMAVMFVGCVDNGVDNNNRNNGDNGGGLVGDWSVVEERYEDSDGNREAHQTPDYLKIFYSFNSSGNATFIELHKISDFWIETIISSQRYSVKGGTVCLDEGDGGDLECAGYSISGNNLTISMSESYERCNSDGCYTYSSSYTMKAVRANLANTKSSLRVYSRNPALEDTYWYKESGSGYRDQIHLREPSFEDYNGNYISFNNSVWYTESNRIIILKMECDRYEYNNQYDYDECVSVSIAQTVTLDYQLSGTTLRLRPTGSTAWDEWTLENQWKTRQRAASPFWALRR